MSNKTTRTWAVMMAAVLTLSLLLTACIKSSDTPAGDNSTPGVTDTQKPEITPDNSKPTGTPDDGNNTSDTGIKPVTDISKYYSADGKEFNIVKCAEDLGFDVRSMSYSEGADDRIAKRALFPFGFPKENYDENPTNIYKDMDDSLCYDSEKSQFIYIPAHYLFTDVPGVADEPYYTFAPFSVSKEVNAKEKNILITGRPTEDESAPAYKKIYANAEIIDAWVWFLEHIMSFDNSGAFFMTLQFKPSFYYEKYFVNETQFDIAQCAAALGYSINGEHMMYATPNGGNYYVNLVGPPFWNIIYIYCPPGIKLWEYTGERRGCVIRTNLDTQTADVELIGISLSESGTFTKEDIRNIVWYLEQIAAKTPAEIQAREIDIQKALRPN